MRTLWKGSLCVDCISPLLLALHQADKCMLRNMYLRSDSLGEPQQQSNMYNAPEVSTIKPLVKQKVKQDVDFDYLPSRERTCVLLSIQ